MVECIFGWGKAAWHYAQDKTSWHRSRRRRNSSDRDVTTIMPDILKYPPQQLVGPMLAAGSTNRNTGDQVVEVRQVFHETCSKAHRPRKCSIIHTESPSQATKADVRVSRKFFELTLTRKTWYDQVGHAP
jgi:hypothetical protein